MKVCIRIERNGGALAVFPGMYEGYGMVDCYAHVGQHCVAEWLYLRYETRPASPEEAAPLLRELSQIGYKDLEIIKKLPTFRWMIKNNWKKELVLNHG